VNGKAVVARFAYPQRAGESAAYAEWMTRHGYRAVETRHVNEGQGDLLVVGSIILAGCGFRTERQAHDEISASLQMPVFSLELVDPRFYHLDTALAVLDDTTVAYYPPAFTDESRARLLELFPDAIEVAKLVGMPVISLELVDPRFYHLDTALAVLDDETIAYYPPAFSDDARARLQAMFPGAIEVTTADAYVLGLNAVSDGLHVVLPVAATGFAKQLTEAGFEPIGVDLSELLKGGGSVKCCTLEVHP